MKDDKALRIAEREGLCSLSSNTKWQRLIPLIAGFPCRKRIKFVNSPEPTPWQISLWQPSPGYVEAAGGPAPLNLVEWIEIERFEQSHRGRLVDPVSLDHSDAILSALEAAHASFRETESTFTILGYSRSATSSHTL
jgi:hypothetical protein